jgi:predicted phosphodiesterase
VWQMPGQGHRRGSGDPPHVTASIQMFLAILLAAALAPAANLELPLKPKSVRFAVMGDNGSGEKAQYQTAAQMAEWRQRFPFEFVLMLGDNLYGHKRPEDFKRKFEDPYKPLLDAGVKFYAALGNHDNPNERFYKPFNMGGNRYYKFSAGNAEFFALDSNYMDPQQLDWLAKQLDRSNAAWKVPFFHHPLYSNGRFHGPDTDLRALLEPIFGKSGVRVVLSGHEHVYERLQPQKGIHYFVVGNSGELRPHNLRPSPEMAKGYDTDRTFMLVEITGDQFCFQVISRRGETVDAGVIRREEMKTAQAASSLLAPMPGQGARRSR